MWYLLANIWKSLEKFSFKMVDGETRGETLESHKIVLEILFSEARANWYSQKWINTFAEIHNLLDA